MSTSSTWPSDIESLPAGFRAAGVACGIKSSGGRDLALIVADRPATAAGVYTQNRYRAAPVEWDAAITPSGGVRAVVVNSGNANACTGTRGWQDVREMAALTADRIGAAAEQVLVLSTGIIGEFLPMESVRSGIEAAAAGLCDRPQSFFDAADAMMTTDRVRKVASAQVAIADTSARFVGLAKGAGMIAPRMGTMLAVIATDLSLGPEQADRMLRQAVDRSFNCISVDGHTSTNDTVLLLASGAAGRSVEAADEPAVQQALDELCVDLARRIPADGEGASHLIAIAVRGCRSGADARRIARTVADSPLVKTAVAGADPNWGRITSAAGYSGVPFDPNRLILSVCGTRLFAQGGPVDFDAAALQQVMRDRFEIEIDIDIQEGSASCRFWASDLTHDYVTINAEYHT